MFPLSMDMIFLLNTMNFFYVNQLDLLFAQVVLAVP